MTDPVHPLFRSERRFAWVLQVVIVTVMVGLLIADLTGDGEPVGGPETSSSVAPTTGVPDATAPSTTSSSESASTPGTTPTTAEGPSRTFTLVATGDSISHGAVAERAATYARENGDDGWNFTPLFARIRPIIAGADLALCHLESCLLYTSPSPRD